MPLGGGSPVVLGPTLFLCARVTLARQKNAGTKMTNDPADEVSIERLHAAVKLLDAGWKLGQPLPGEPGFSLCCSRCKTHLLASASFCRNCGQALESQKSAKEAGKPIKFAAWALIAGCVGLPLIGSVVELVRPTKVHTTAAILADPPTSSVMPNVDRLATDVKAPSPSTETPAVPPGFVPESQVQAELPASEIAKLVGSDGVIAPGFGEVNGPNRYLSGKFYNGSAWSIQEITVVVMMRRPDGRLLSSETHTRVVEVGVGAVGHFGARLDCSLESGMTWEWRILGAKGCRASP